MFIHGKGNRKQEQSFKFLVFLPVLSSQRPYPSFHTYSHIQTIPGLHKFILFGAFPLVSPELSLRESAVTLVQHLPRDYKIGAYVIKIMQPSYKKGRD